MSAFTDIIERLRAIVFRGRDERELDEELRFHVEMDAAQHQRAGLDAAEARRRGLIGLGGIERTKEDARDARGTRMFEDAMGDIGFAVRALMRRPGFAIVATLTLAVGIGGTTAVFSAVHAVLLAPLPYEQPGRLVRLYQSYGKEASVHGFVTPVHFLAYRGRLDAFQAAAAILTYSETGADIGTGDAVRRIRLLPVSADYFEVLGERPALGRPFERADEAGPGAVQDIQVGTPTVIVSHDLWLRELHGNPAAVGGTLWMSGRSHRVTGVMPAGFTDPVAGAIDAWVPMDLRAGYDDHNASNHYLSVLARLRPGVTIAAAQSELDVLGASLASRYPNAKDKRARLYPLKEDVVGSSSRALEIMLGAVALVLMLVCVNIANLLLVRGSERAHELALRAALGAGRVRLVRQMLMESLVLALAGDALGLIVARLGMSAIVALGAGSIPRLAALHLDGGMLGFSLVIATLSAVGFGLAPALRAARTDPGDVLRDQSRSATGGGRSMRLREWLVVSQVALAFVLLVGAGLLIASFQRLREVDLGFQSAGALVFDLHLPDARYDSIARGRFYEEFAAAAERIPGVTAAGGISRLPATGEYHQWGTQALSGPFANDGQKGNVDAEQRVVSGEYFKAAGIPVLEGRLFDARDDAAAPGRAVVSRTLARTLFPGISAVGQRIEAGGRSSEIIGVVGDVSVNAEGREDRYVYHAHAQWAGDRNWSLVQVVRAEGPLEDVRSAARRTLAVMDPQLVMFKPETLAAAVGRSEAQRVFTLRILGSFAVVALALSALGLFGVLSYGVRLRTREFGIRMALGAEAGAVRRMILTQGLTMMALGTVIGLVAAAALSRVVSSMVFHVSALDPRVLLGVVSVMAVASGMAAWVPAWRATRVDPRTALQE